MRLITQWYGGRDRGMGEIAAKIELSKHKKKYPQYIVTVEDAGRQLQNGTQAKKIVVRDPN